MKRSRFAGTTLMGGAVASPANRSRRRLTPEEERLLAVGAPRRTAFGLAEVAPVSTPRRLPHSYWSAERVEELRALSKEGWSIESVCAGFDLTQTQITEACTRFKISRPFREIWGNPEWRELENAPSRVAATDGPLERYAAEIVKGWIARGLTPRAVCRRMGELESDLWSVAVAHLKRRLRDPCGEY